MDFFLRKTKNVSQPGGIDKYKTNLNKSHNIRSPDELFFVSFWDQKMKKATSTLPRPRDIQIRIRRKYNNKMK